MDTKADKLEDFLNTHNITLEKAKEWIDWLLIIPTKRGFDLHERWDCKEFSFFDLDFVDLAQFVYVCMFYIYKDKKKLEDEDVEDREELEHDLDFYIDLRDRCYRLIPDELKPTELPWDF